MHSKESSTPNSQKYEADSAESTATTGWDSLATEAQQWRNADFANAEKSADTTNRESDESESDFSQLQKVGDQQGSNDGGWYENSETGDRFYVKFYENPNQGRCEYIANAVYRKLGIRAVDTQIAQIDGRPAVASKAIPGAMSTDRQAQRDSDEIRGGFVADAYLANWDVIGLNYDNVVQGDDDHMYRVDNGGSLIFRARGEGKDYSPNSIPELRSMMFNDRPTGNVFSGISNAEIMQQITTLVDTLQPQDLEEIVDQSGLEGDARQQVLEGLVGRREYLVNMLQRHDLESELRRRPLARKSFSEVLRATATEAEHSSERKVRPSTEVVCDHDHIEGQRIDIVDASDVGQIQVNFKLTSATYQKVLERLAAASQAGDENVKSGKIGYLSSQKQHYSLTEAYVIEQDGVYLKVAKPDKDGIRSTLGMVRIAIPTDMQGESVEDTIGQILQEQLGIDDALGEVSEESERAYMQAQYRWHHKLEGDDSQGQGEPQPQLERHEVSPGYSAVVEPGKHLEYAEKYGDILPMHKLFTGDAASIYRVLTTGLMSSSSRYARGLLRDGMSTMQDFRTGGADSVFVRSFTADRTAREGRERGAYVVFDPALYDRTDWYAYDFDHFGSTEEDVFQFRLSPDELFSKISQRPESYGTNEQMFRNGIGPDYVSHIQVEEQYREQIIQDLKDLGMTEFHGSRIEDIIVPIIPQPTTPVDLANLNNFEWPNSQPLEQLAVKKYLTFDEIINSDIDEYPIDQVVEGLSVTTSQELAQAAQKYIDAGKGDALMMGFHDMLLSVSTPEAVKAFLDGNTGGPDDKAFCDTLQTMLGVDFNQIYEDLLKKQQSEASQPTGGADESTTTSSDLSNYPGWS